MPKNAKDLIVLVADSNTKAAIDEILKRHESLGIREISFDSFVHPYHDPGCLQDSHTFLQPFVELYDNCVVIFDQEGCGQENKQVEVLESLVLDLLSRNGWNNRSFAVVINPELETWVWKNSPHVSKAIGWAEGLDDLFLWLKDKGFIEENQIRPNRPKEALEAVLRRVKKPRSSSIYSELGSKLSLRKCTDPSFLRLKGYLQSCFPIL